MFSARRAVGALAVVFLSSLLTGGATAQTSPPATPGTGQLTRGFANPILRNDSWYDDLKAGPSTVVKVGPGDYRQWYEALDQENSPGFGDVLSQTAYATSPDGTSWTKQGVVFEPLGWPSWERSEACPTSIHWDGSKWILFYHGGNNTSPRAIGRATSTTGTGSFTRNGAPILQRGGPGAWDGRFVADAKVVPPWEGPDGLWRMYYVGRNAAGQGQVGLATSTDGIDFTKAGSNPVVSLGAPGAWDGSDIQAFTPEWDRQLGLFRAWYVAGSAAGYAWSADGVNWNRGSENPVLTSVPGDEINDSIDSYLDSGQYRIVYGQYDLGAYPALRGKGEAWAAAQVAATASTGTVSFRSGAGGDVERGIETYPPSADAPVEVRPSEGILLVRRSKTPWAYQPVRVGVLSFDTSELPDDAVVTSAELQLHVLSTDSSDGRSLVAEWYSSSSWAVDETAWALTDSDSAHAGTPLEVIAPGRQNAFALQNLGSIDPRGSTALRLHVNGAELSPTGFNDFAFAGFAQTVLPSPTLLVTYQRSE